MIGQYYSRSEKCCAKYIVGTIVGTPCMRGTASSRICNWNIVRLATKHNFTFNFKRVKDFVRQLEQSHHAVPAAICVSRSKEGSVRARDDSIRRSHEDPTRIPRGFHEDPTRRNRERPPWKCFAIDDACASWACRAAAAQLQRRETKANRRETSRRFGSSNGTPQPEVRTKRFPIHRFPSPQSLLFPFLFAIDDKFTRSLRSILRTSLTIAERYTQLTLFLFLSLCERNDTSRNGRTSERTDTVPAKSLKTLHDSDLVRHDDEQSRTYSVSIILLCSSSSYNKSWSISSTLDTRIFLFEKCIRYSVDIVSQTALLLDTHGASGCGSVR